MYPLFDLRQAESGFEWKQLDFVMALQPPLQITLKLVLFAQGDPSNEVYK
jgi:hypothetical protein